MAPTELVGLAEISDLLGVEHATTHRWRTRRLLPDPDGVPGGSLSGTPIWRKSTIIKWAKATGRWERDSV